MIIGENNKTLKIGNESIPYNLQRGKPNRVKLSFSDEMTLKIETSTGNLGRFEKEFLESKKRWILKAFLNRKEANNRKENLLSDVNRQIPILGEITLVQYLSDSKSFFKFKKGEPFLVYAPAPYIKAHKKKLLYYALREFATRFLVRRVEHWSQKTELDYNRLRVKDLKSKWGSCSAKRNLNLNWQLIFLREELIDYVILHEFMHLIEMNHSPQFWALVGQFCPDFKGLRKELKEKSWLVGILK